MTDWNEELERVKGLAYQNGHMDGFHEGVKAGYKSGYESGIEDARLGITEEDIDKDLRDEYEEDAYTLKRCGNALILFGLLSIVVVSMLWDKYQEWTMLLLNLVNKNRVPVVLLSGFFIMSGLLFSTHGNRTLEELEIEEGLVKGDDY